MNWMATLNRHPVKKKYWGGWFVCYLNAYSFKWIYCIQHWRKLIGYQHLLFMKIYIQFIKKLEIITFEQEWIGLKHWIDFKQILLRLCQNNQNSYWKLNERVQLDLFCLILKNMLRLVFLLHNSPTNISAVKISTLCFVPHNEFLFVFPTVTVCGS